MFDFAGEMMDRDYDWSKFTKESLYGVPTPHDNSGSGVKSAMHWLHLARRYVDTPRVFMVIYTYCRYIHTYIEWCSTYVHLRMKHKYCIRTYIRIFMQLTVCDKFSIDVRTYIRM